MGFSAKLFDSFPIALGLFVQQVQLRAKAFGLGLILRVARCGRSHYSFIHKEKSITVQSVRVTSARKAEETRSDANHTAKLFAMSIVIEDPTAESMDQSLKEVPLEELSRLKQMLIEAAREETVEDEEAEWRRISAHSAARFFDEEKGS